MMGFDLSLLLRFTLFILLFFCKIQFIVSKSASPGEIAIDKEALIYLKSQISMDVSNSLSYWNPDSSPCNWTGVFCDGFGQRVEGLDLSGLQLKGSISPYIGNLTSLRSLQLQNNQLTGNLPQQLGNLARLQLLNASFNSITGVIPGNISHCKGLRTLDLMQNEISGGIPEEISQFRELQILNLARNHLSGKIPSSIANISSLVVLNLGTNDLGGLIPSNFACLENLKKLDLTINNFTGTVPNTIYNMSTLVALALASNNLWGEFPINIGATLPNLLDFNFCFNDFTGRFPSSLHNLTRIKIIRVAHNHLEGSVPPGLGNLAELEMYNIGYNKFVNSGENGLSFLDSLANSTHLSFLALDYNLFEGKIPESVGNLSKVLKKFYLAGNRLYGSIPSSFRNLRELALLSLSYNSISGEIPSAIGQLGKLQEIGLAGNHLSGKIPNSLGNLLKLSSIDLSGNELVGSIPLTFGNFKYLLSMDLSKNKLNGSIPREIFHLSGLSIFLNLSENNFSGSLPEEVGLLEDIATIDISNNHLSGGIPKSIGNCRSLEHLLLYKNMLSGIIPNSLGNIRGLESLDLSSNQLSGAVPFDLQKLQALQLLNLSFNNLIGEVPTGGVFEEPSRVHLEGNQNLCWKSTCRKNSSSRWLLILLCTITPLATILVICVLIFAFLFHTRKRKANAKIQAVSDSFGGQHQMISYTELRLATNCFNEQNLIGSGSFASVYVGHSSEEGKVIAVKVIDTEVTGAWNNFLAECTAMKHVRHRNIIKLITTCSIVDFKRADFLALVFEFMSNGNLEDWITRKRRTTTGEGLNILDRLNVAIDVASAVNYLQNECEVPVVHCDLKPANIFFDSDMTAKVGDFGLAQLLMKSKDDEQPPTSSTCTLKGSIGYIPPEYGAGMKPSPAGDVYSFGITLLQLFTGRSPRDESFSEGLSLKKWVEMKYQAKMQEPELVLNHQELLPLDEMRNDCLVDEIIQVGLSCAADCPEERLAMKDALHKLECVKVRLMTKPKELSRGN